MDGKCLPHKMGMSIPQGNLPEIPQGSGIWEIAERQGEMRRVLCEYKHIEIKVAHAMPNLIHMSVSVPLKRSMPECGRWFKEDGLWEKERRRWDA